MRTIKQIEAEIETQFGFIPPFFSPARQYTQILENLWQQTLCAYIHNPLPELFKEKLSAYLSRYCAVPYCMICHSCSLRPLGMTASEILHLLESSPSLATDIDTALKILAAQPGKLTIQSTLDSTLEASLLCCSTVIFLGQQPAEQCRNELRRLLHPLDYQHLMGLIAYLKTCHIWIEAHPEVADEADKRVQNCWGILLEEEPGLADFFRNYQHKIAQEGQNQVVQLQQEVKEQQQAHDDLESLVEQRTAELFKANQLLRAEIAKRKQAEATVQKEQEFLKVLLDNVQAGIVACNADGVLTLFNRAAKEFHGLPAQPLLPEQWAQYYDLYLPDGKTPMKREDIPLFRALQGQNVQNVEMAIVPKQGLPRTLLASGQGIVDAQGQKQGAVVVMHDITARKQVEESLLISDAALQQMPDAILLTDLEGKIQRWLGKAEQIFGYTALEVMGKPVNFLHRPDIQETMTGKIIQAIQETGEFCGEIPCLRKDGSEVPIETTAKTVYDKKGQPLFFIGINRDITERKQAEAERAQLIREQSARLEAEAGQQRAAFLVEVSTVLASSLDYERTLTSVANLVVPYFADWCAVDLLEESQSIARVAVAHCEPEKVKLGWELHRRYPKHLNMAEGVSKVMRSGQAAMAAEIPDATLAAMAQDAEHLKILRELGLKSCIVSPLVTRGRVLGAISFVHAESGRHYTTADLSLAEEIARRAAIAIDNARLYREAQQAQQAAERTAERIARLQSVTAALSESLTPAQVAEVIVERGVASLGANSVLVALVSESGSELEIVRALGYHQDLVEAWRRFPLNADVPLAEAIRTGQPMWAETLESRLTRYPHLAEMYARYNLQAWISVPLMVEGRAVGGITLGFCQAQSLHEDDRAFILAIAQQSAQAIARAHLYEAERTARSTAEVANRVKDEFLAVLSHELRTPLNPILGWTRLLSSGHLDQKKRALALETIERNAKLQAQLIEDLLDVSRILQGKLRLDTSPVDLVATLEAAIETVRLSAEAKSIDLKFVIGSGGAEWESGGVGEWESGGAGEILSSPITNHPLPITVLGDASRLQQIFWNLLSNAIKFTPAGGRVEVQLEALQIADCSRLPMEPKQSESAILNLKSEISYAQITVTDTGKGIRPDFLPYVFDSFRQADSTTTRKFGGLGLGLSIVRHLVELHGGAVQAESAGEGEGATFRVKLPLMVPNPEEQPDNSSVSSVLDLQGIRVLAVDDDRDSLELLAFILEQRGAIVAVATSAENAIAQLTPFQPDVLVCDIGMPEMDGYALVRQVKMRSPAQGGQVPAIALTAYAGEYDRQQALAAGFERHLSKPLEPEELVSAIAQATNRER